MVMDEQKRVLVIENDPSTSDFLKRLLTLNNYQASTARTEKEAYQYIDSHGVPHIVLMDVHLEDVDAFELGEGLQRRTSVPIIIITADDSEQSILRGLRFADDYVVKPFIAAALILRIQNVLRRIADFSYAHHPPVKLNDRLAIDPTKRCVIVAGETIQLTPTEHGLLMTLLRHRGRTVNASTLIANVWRFNEVYEDTLRVHIHRLRTKIEADPGNPEVIVTERGVGYALKV